MEKRAVRRLDLFSRYAVGAAKNAAADADFDLSENLRELIQMGAFVGFDLDAGEPS